MIPTLDSETRNQGLHFDVWVYGVLAFIDFFNQLTSLHSHPVETIPPRQNLTLPT